jgi:TatD DNase family protein
MLVDSHCHLDYYTEAEIEAVLARARAGGVAEMVTIGTRMGEQAATVKRLAERFAGVWATVGVHPHNAGEPPMPEVADLLAAAEHPRVIGLGESGLDYFYDKSPRDLQREGFRRHIRAARESGLPLVVHARDADDDIATILEEEHTAGPFGFVLHCFSSGRRLAQRALALGGYVSFSGILTFPKSQELRDIAQSIPEDRLLVETDAPYLAPVPFRGKRNEPGYVPHTAAVLAQTRGVEPARIAEVTTANFRRLFPRAA